MNDPDWLTRTSIGDWVVVTRFVQAREYEKAVEFLVDIKSWPREKAQGSVARIARRLVCP